MKLNLKARLRSSDNCLISEGGTISILHLLGVELSITCLQGK